MEEGEKMQLALEFAKAKSLIVVTVAGITSDVVTLFPATAEDSIVLIVEGIVNIVLAGTRINVS